MKNKSISIILASVMVVFFTACQKDQDPTQAPDAGKILFQKGSDQIMIWRLDENGNVADTKEYGPFPGWYVINYSDNKILWGGPNSRASLWIMDELGNQISYKEYQGGLNWLPMRYADGKILWGKANSGYGGLAALWTVDEDGNVVDKDDYSIDTKWYVCGYSDSKILWKSFESGPLSGEVRLTFLDNEGSIINSRSHGPFYGWGVEAGAIDGDKILWNYYSVNKGISLWAIDPQGNQKTYKEYYGAFHPNLPAVYSDDKLLIRYDDLINFSLWTIDANCNKTSSKDYKNPDGWYATQYTR